MESLIGLFTGGAGSAISAIGGGIIGGIASIFRLRHDFKMEKLKIEDRDKERENNIVVQKLEIAGAEKMKKLKMDELVTTKDFEGLITSVKSDMAAYSKAFADKMSPWAANIVGVMLGFVDFCRGMIRPGIAVYSVYFMFNKIWRLIPQSAWDAVFNKPEIAATMAMATLNACIFMSTTAVAWWFGSRPSKPPRGEKK